MSSHPNNEPILNYEVGSKEREDLEKEIEKQLSEIIEIPCIINGKEIYTNNTVTQVIPHNHKHILANVHLATQKEMKMACESAVSAQEEWINLGLEGRSKIFQKCADLLATTWRMKVNASSMLNQSKTAFQAEIDSAC